MSSIGGHGNQEFELNIAPIIDCFTVLITYLLVSASFISLSVLEVGVAATGQSSAAPPPGEPPLSIAVQLSASRQMTVKVTNGKNINESIDIVPAATTWNLATLTEKLESLKKTYSTFSDVSVTADPSVQYKDLVRIIETIKKTTQKVFLSG